MTYLQGLLIGFCLFPVGIMALARLRPRTLPWFLGVLVHGAGGAFIITALPHVAGPHRLLVMVLLGFIAVALIMFALVQEKRRLDEGHIPSGVRSAQRQSPQRSSTDQDKATKLWDIAVTGAFFGLPISQYIGYLTYRTPTSFFLPLAIALPVIFVRALVRPSAAQAEAPNVGRLTRNVGMMAAAIAVISVLPVSGIGLMIRGILIDVFALQVTAYLCVLLRPHERRASA